MSSTSWTSAGPNASEGEEEEEGGNEGGEGKEGGEGEGDGEDTEDDDEEECAVPEGAAAAARDEAVPPMPMPPLTAQSAFSAFSAAKNAELGNAVPNGAWGVIAAKVGEVLVGGDEEADVSEASSSKRTLDVGNEASNGEGGKRAKTEEAAAGQGAAGAGALGSSNILGAVKCILRDGLPDI